RDPQADVWAALWFREREHVLRDLRGGPLRSPSRGRDRGGQEAGRAGFRADCRTQDGRVRHRAGGLARQTADRADQARARGHSQDAGQGAEEEGRGEALVGPSGGFAATSPLRGEELSFKSPRQSLVGPSGGCAATSPLRGEELSFKSPRQ